MNSKTKLSKSILEMKFMKKTKEKVELQDAEAEGR
jgi:M-phase phosphoprotein 6